MIFHIPHASRVIPSKHRIAFSLNDQQLTTELKAMTDAYTDELFGSHAKNTDAVIVFPISRLIIDPERFLDDNEEEMARVGMGAIYTNTSTGEKLRDAPSRTERETFIKDYYQPHHASLSNAVEIEIEKSGRALILDCHSFPSSPLPYELIQDPDRPDICIGTDDFHTSQALHEGIQASAKELGWQCKLNRPFSGTIVPSEFYKKNSLVESIMIEVNRSLYMDESTGGKSPDFENCRVGLGTIISALRNYKYSG